MELHRCTVEEGVGGLAGMEPDELEAAVMMG